MREMALFRRLSDAWRQFAEWYAQSIRLGEMERNRTARSVRFSVFDKWR